MTLLASCPQLPCSSQDFGRIEYALQTALHAVSPTLVTAWELANPHLGLKFEKRSFVRTKSHLSPSCRRVLLSSPSYRSFSLPSLFCFFIAPNIKGLTTVPCWVDPSPFAVGGQVNYDDVLKNGLRFAVPEGSTAPEGHKFQVGSLIPPPSALVKGKSWGREC
jgi:hypothetical protein